MASEISKENLVVVANFISQSINDQRKILEKINSSEYTHIDMFDYECMDYFIAGLMGTLGCFLYEHQFTKKNEQVYLEILNIEKQLTYGEITNILNCFYSSMREVTLQSVNDPGQISYEHFFDNHFLEYNKILLFMYYFYGSKIVCSFLGFNVDGRINSSQIVSIEDDETITKESLEEFRRYISNISSKLKEAIEIEDKINITNTRIEALNVRKERVYLFGTISNKSYRASNENELQYLEHRINYFNTELIKFRNESRILEEEINESLKAYCINYLGVDVNNE